MCYVITLQLFYNITVWSVLMKIAYVFKTGMASTFQLGSMILPQLESDTHMVDVVGMFFFDDNIFCLQKDNPVGERLSKIAKEKGMLLMVCDQCAVGVSWQRELLSSVEADRLNQKDWWMACKLAVSHNCIRHSLEVLQTK